MRHKGSEKWLSLQSCPHTNRFPPWKPRREALPAQCTAPAQGAQAPGTHRWGWVQLRGRPWELSNTWCGCQNRGESIRLGVLTLSFFFFFLNIYFGVIVKQELNCISPHDFKSLDWFLDLPFFSWVDSDNLFNFFYLIFLHYWRGVINPICPLGLY